MGRTGWNGRVGSREITIVVWMPRLSVQGNVAVILCSAVQLVQWSLLGSSWFKETKLPGCSFPTYLKPIILKSLKNEFRRFKTKKEGIRLCSHIWHSWLGRRMRHRISEPCPEEFLIMIEGCLEVKLPTIWTDEKQRWSRRIEKSRREDQRRERVRRKKMQVHEKVGKSRNTVFFQWFVAPEGRKVGSLKRRARSPLARWEMKNCTPFWREADFEVKMLKTPHSDHFWKLRCRKSARRCGAKHMSKSKCTKHTRSGPLLEVEMSKKCTPLWREAHVEVKSAKDCGVRSIFGRSDVLSRGRRKGWCTLSKVSKTRRFCSISKNYDRRGTFEEDLQRWISHGRRSTRDTLIRDVGGQFGVSDLQVCWDDFAWQVQHSVTSYDLASLFCARRSTLDRWSGKIAKRIGTRPSALHSTFHFWRKSRRIASFLMLSASKNEEVSQNFFVFDVVKFENLRTSRRIASFSSLQVDRQTGRQADKQRDRQIDR